jgi:hypothetical protein
MRLLLRSYESRFRSGNWGPMTLASKLASIHNWESLVSREFFMRFVESLCLLLALAGISAAQDTNFSTGPQYLITTPSTMFLHSIATPSLSFGPASAPAPQVTTETVTASQVVETPPALPSNVDLTSIYWGGREGGGISSEIELTAAPTPQNLPASIVDVGVTAMFDSQTLREEGYGISLGEAAAFWKMHGGHALHTYTNKDVEHTPGS